MKRLFLLYLQLSRKSQCSNVLNKDAAVSGVFGA